jgi:4-amino-4-deoxy-L-arabinose transferase-like glycosyltransferase
VSSRGIPALALLLCGLAVVLFFRIGELPPTNPAEARVGAVVHEMVRSGDWLVPRVDGEPRLQKPPGYYWLAASLSRLAGETSWSTIRAGSAVAALALVGVIYGWGRAIGGPPLGIAAALCLGTMQFTFAFGRRGVAEMMLTCFVALALASFDRVRFEGRTRWLPLFGVALAAAILAKATAALFFVGLPVGLQLLLDGRPGRETARRVMLWSAGACIAGFGWYAAVLAAVPGAAATVIAEAILPLGIQSGAGSALHYHSPTHYLAPLLFATLPAALFLPLVVHRCVQSRLYAADPRRRFVAIGFLSLLVALLLLPQKQRHYLLPVLPLLALLLAESLVDLQSRSPERVAAWLRPVTALVVPIGVAAVLALGCFYGEFLGVSIARRALLEAAGVLLLSALAWSAAFGRLRAFAALGTLTALTSMLVWFGSIHVWRSQFEAGTARSRPDYDGERWERASEAHPLIGRFMRGIAPGSAG